MRQDTVRTRFILIEPSHAGNVGAAARAMKVMGFDDLVLVAPRWGNVLARAETVQRASGAVDVLQKARVVATLDGALHGMTHLCATVMTPRDFGPPTRNPRAHFDALLGRAPRANAAAADDDDNAQDGASATPATEPAPQGVALLFGCERFGMKNEDVYRCHVALSIAANPDFGSLNLAAAVQLLAYEWRMALGGFAAPATENLATAAARRPALADAAQLAGMLAHWEQALTAIGFLDPSAPKKLMPRLARLFNRADLRSEEVHILRGIAKTMLETASTAAMARGDGPKR
ncbi:MAG: RNA methyltransferase [Burkholderiaceae bacterium]|jgi:tRNA/rRNA methyltransferase|nr:RNA methyltransferase [Burkholderiaceae bacterium]